MSADVLRRAVREIRREQEVEENLGHIDGRTYAAWLAVADWLEGLADAMTNPDAPNAGATTAREEQAALTVARAFLGEQA